MPTTEKSSRLTELIRLLNQATDRGALPWEASLDEDEFRAFLNAGLVKITKTEEVHLIADGAPFGPPAPHGGNVQKEKYTIQILDSSNRAIDFLAPATLEEHEQLKELFWKARRSALHVDQFYGALLNELKSRAGQ